MTKHTTLNGARLNFRISFGYVKREGEENPNTGNQEEIFVESFSRWAGLWHMTQYQTMTLAGQGIKDTITFAVWHHDDEIMPDMTVVYKGKEYSIYSYNTANDGNNNDYDLIVCQRKEEN